MSSPRAADVVLLTALPVEHRAVLRALGGVTRVGPYRVVARCLAGMGNTGAAAGTQQLIDTLHPAAVLLIGIAGGAPTTSGLALGDVLVADTVVGYEPGRHDKAGLHRRPDVHRPDFALLAAAREVEPGEWAPFIDADRPGRGPAQPRSHLGTVLSGEKVIADGRELARLSRAWPNTVGVEMEGLGVATASYRSGAGFLLIKAVSDLADQDKDDGWQEYASEAAARFALAVLRREPLTKRADDEATTEAEADEPRMFALAPAHRSPCRLGAVAGSIRRIRFADAWVSSENTDMEMSRAAEFTISGIVRYWGARRDGGGRIVDDTIARQLAEQVGSRRPVMPGAAFVTGPGSLADSHHVRAIIHVASVQGEPGAGFRQVRNVGVCVTNALALAESLDVTSIVFPLLGVGSGHGDPQATATAMITAAIDHLDGRATTGLRAIYFLGYTQSELDTLTTCLKESPYLQGL
ncbi:macro domain-containing protein [Actinoplanes sp. CA-051413]|uniref:phosphorylase family protein n=1 Tax=Actinoplanes sp. CA-051413 TaxID=3239899 RepID=UPI003D95EABD